MKARQLLIEATQDPEASTSLSSSGRMRLRFCEAGVADGSPASNNHVPGRPNSAADLARKCSNATAHMRAKFGHGRSRPPTEGAADDLLPVSTQGHRRSP